MSYYNYQKALLKLLPLTASDAITASTTATNNIVSVIMLVQTQCCNAIRNAHDHKTPIKRK